MAYSVFSYATGRATSGAAGSVRPAAATGKTADALQSQSQSPEAEANRRKQASADSNQAAEAAARRAAQKDAGEDSPETSTTPEERIETIRKLKEIESQALYSGGPPTARERRDAQLAHALIVRENSALRAQELEASWKERERREAARFLAGMAAAAYRQLDGYAGHAPGPLIH